MECRWSDAVARTGRSTFENVAPPRGTKVYIRPVNIHLPIRQSSAAPHSNVVYKFRFLFNRPFFCMLGQIAQRPPKENSLGDY